MFDGDHTATSLFAFAPQLPSDHIVVETIREKSGEMATYVLLGVYLQHTQ